MRKPQSKRDDPKQSERFIAAAKATGADDDEETFKRKLGVIAKAKATKKPKYGK